MHLWYENRPTTKTAEAQDRVRFKRHVKKDQVRRIFTLDSIGLYAIARICHATPIPSVRLSVLSHACIVSQESCAIAKMTAQCALYMDALKFSGLPDYAHGYYSQHFHGLLFGSTLWMFLPNLKSVALSVPDIIGGTQKNSTVVGYAHAPFFDNF